MTRGRQQEGRKAAKLHFEGKMRDKVKQMDFEKPGKSSDLILIRPGFTILQETHH